MAVPLPDVVKVTQDHEEGIRNAATLLRECRRMGAPCSWSVSRLLALEWLIEGYGYDVTGADVWAAYSSTLAAAERLGTSAEAKKRIREMVAAERAGGFVSQVLRRELGL